MEISATSRNVEEIAIHSKAIVSGQTSADANLVSMASIVSGAFRFLAVNTETVPCRSNVNVIRATKEYSVKNVRTQLKNALSHLPSSAYLDFPVFSFPVS